MEYLARAQSQKLSCAEGPMGAPEYLDTCFTAEAGPKAVVESSSVVEARVVAVVDNCDLHPHLHQATQAGHDITGRSARSSAKAVQGPRGCHESAKMPCEETSPAKTTSEWEPS